MKDERYDVRLVAMPPEELDDFHHGLANQLIWPLAHALPERCRVSASQWRSYGRANRRFAAAALEIRPETPGVVWVHDYQLALVPRFVREEVPDARIAMFWHIPFPPPDLMRINPWHRELLRSLLSSDLIAFHRHGDVQNFLDCVQGSSAATVDREHCIVRHGRTTTHVRAVPLGINVRRFNRIARTEAARRTAEKIRREYRAEQLALGVDRLDYTKGIVEKLSALEMLFMTSPGLKGRFTLVQIAAPSREGISDYRRLRDQVETVARRVNARFEGGGWSPVQLVMGGLPQDELIPFYMAADLLVVTPLRDGMNLVAKEYVASRPDGNGTVVLSRFAGVADDFGEQAVLVNPSHPIEMAIGLRRAFEMSGEQRRARMSRMQSSVWSRDVDWWIEQLIGELDAATSDPVVGGAPPHGVTRR